MKRLLVISALVLGVAGCATPARIDQMSVVSPTRYASGPLKDSVGIKDVTGGRDTNPMWTSQVSSDDFRRALENSLQRAGLFSKVGSGSKFALTADLTRLDQPLIGFDLTVTATVRYSIVDSQTRKEVYTRVIQLPFTAGMADSMLGPERLKIANEGAIRVNIEEFIKDLVSLKIATN